MTEPLHLAPPLPPGAGSLAALLGDDLAQAPELMRALLDATPARVIVIDEDENLVYANDGFFAFTKLHPKQVLGRHIAQIIGEQAHASYAPIRERLHRGETVRWEGWTPLAGQGPRYMREHLVPCGLRPDGARPRATVVMSLDLTALKQRDAELSGKVQQLETTEALKSSIVDHALAGLVSSDDQGRIVEFNPAAEAMFGFDRAAVLGRPVAEVMVPARHREAHARGMQRMREGQAPRMMGRRVEMPALRADGSEVPVEMVLWRALVNGAAHYTASFTDLSERHRAAREIERQREQLRQSEKLAAMGSLLAGVAHELNNPLAIVLGRAGLLEDKLAAGGQAAPADDARRIREAAERCGRIVRAFLNMARQKPAERGPVRLNELVRAAVELVGYTLRSHGITLELALAEHVPAIDADADQVGQVVLNLIVNAQQVLAGVDGPRHLALHTGADAAGVWLTATDNGPGVDAALHERIFEPFFTTKGEGLGTGLGLSVSRGIARAHGGDLALQAAAQSGACFRLSLPLNKPASPATASAG